MGLKRPAPMQKAPQSDRALGSSRRALAGRKTRGTISSQLQSTCTLFHFDALADRAGKRLIPALPLLFRVRLPQFFFAAVGRKSGQSDRVVHPDPDGGLLRQFHFLALAFHDVDGGADQPKPETSRHVAEDGAHDAPAAALRERAGPDAEVTSELIVIRPVLGVAPKLYERFSKRQYSRPTPHLIRSADGAARRGRGIVCGPSEEYIAA
jgi:hypothetical protein